MGFSITIVGSGSAQAAFGRYPAAQALQIGSSLFLIDCGEGTQFRLHSYVTHPGRISHIFISHLHGDHFFGLPGLLTSWALNGRQTPVWIVSPPGLKGALQSLFDASYTVLPFTCHFQVLEPGFSGLVLETSSLEVTAFPLAHRIPAFGYVFREKKRPNNILPEKIAEYQLDFTQIRAVKAGEDLLLPGGKVILNAELTRPADPPRSYAYCSDTAYSESILPFIQGVDLLFHETTFMEQHAELASLTGHSTARQAALLAAQACAGMLIAGHYSGRYDSIEALLAEAREVFPNSEAAREGRVFAVRPA